MKYIHISSSVVHRVPGNRYKLYLPFFVVGSSELVAFENSTIHVFKMHEAKAQAHAHTILKIAHST